MSKKLVNCTSRTVYIKSYGTFFPLVGSDPIMPDKRGPKLVYNPGAYTQADLPSESLLEAVADKNAKIRRYKEISGLENQWLLLVIGENGPASYEIFEEFEFEEEIEAGLRSYLHLRGLQLQCKTN